MEQLICGCSDLDFEALEKSTVYDGGWTKDSDIIKYGLTYKQILYVTYTS